MDIFQMRTLGRENRNINNCYVSNWSQNGFYHMMEISYIERYWRGRFILTNQDRSLYHLQQRMNDLMINVLVDCFSGPDTPLVPPNQATGINFRQHYKIKERHEANHISYRLWDDVGKRGKIEKSKKQYRFILINNKQLPLNKKGDTMTQLIKF